MAGQINQAHCATLAERVLVKTPWGISVWVHKSVKRRFLLACKRADRFARFTPHRIDSYACRSIRGSDALSWHAKAAAWDFFATEPGVPPPGGVWTPDNTYGESFARCFEDLGFTWGARWTREDDPHMEWRPAYVPSLTLAERVRTFKAAQQRWHNAIDHREKGKVAA